MEFTEIIRTTLWGLFFGTFGTTIGGIWGAYLKQPSKRMISFILQYAAGLMVAVICFELIPEALEITKMANVLLGILLGVVTMLVCEQLVKEKIQRKNAASSNSLLKTGIVVGIGLAIHNFPEGLAIGSGFEASMKLGLTLAVAILFHDIPEGISMAVPMKNGGMSKGKVIWYTLLSGVTTGIGAFFGAVVGSVSQTVIGLCLAFAAGAMLYLVAGELLPESNHLYTGRMATLGNILGLLTGVWVIHL